MLTQVNNNRKCDGCTLCCKTHGIKELMKPSGVYCHHCNIGAGCKIYESRPKSCTGFKCLWLMGYGPVEHRPDISKIVMEFRETDQGHMIILWSEYDEVFGTDAAKKITKSILETQIPVLQVPINGKPRLFLTSKVKVGKKKFLFGEMNPREVEVIPNLEARSI